MDVQQLRSWIFEIFDPLTEDRTYILFDRRAATLVDLPRFDRRAVLRVLGTCDPVLVFFTHAGRAAEAEKWRAALPAVKFAIHEADAGAVPGGVDIAVRDGERLTAEAEVVHVGAHTPGASALLVHRAGGVLFPGDAVVGTQEERLALPDASYDRGTERSDVAEGRGGAERRRSYAPVEKVRAGIEKLGGYEFSSVLSTHGRPVWSAGKDRYMALLAQLPRPEKRFGHMVDAPWDRNYRGYLQDQMVRNPITPAADTIAPAAAHGPSTLVPAWERRPPREVKWPAASAVAPAAGAERAPERREERRPAAAPTGSASAASSFRVASEPAGSREARKRWSLASEFARELPPRPHGPVETLPRPPEPSASRFRRFTARELLTVPFVDYWWRSLDLSPDGTEVVFAWNRTGDFEIYRAPISGESIYQLTTGAARSVQPRFSPDGCRIAFLRDDDGDERFEVWLVDRDGAHEQKLTSTTATRMSIAWSPDGRSLAYLSNEAGRLGIWRLEVGSGTARPVVAKVRHPGADVIAPAWSADGRFLAYHSASDDDPTNVELHVVPADGGAPPWKIETHSGASARAVLPAWGPRDEWLAFTTDLRGRSEVALVPIRDGRAAGAVRYLREAHFDDFGPVWQPGGRALLYRRSIDATVSVRRAYVVSLDDEPALDAPGVHVDLGTARADGSIVYVWSGPTAPADVYVKGPTDVGSHPLTRSLPPGIDPAALVRPRHVRYPGADGELVPALLYEPHPDALAGAPGRPPAVVYAHGGPTAQHFQWWDPVPQWFCNNGYVVLAPNVRGSTGYGRAFREANRKDWGGKDLADLVAGADWLDSERIAEGARIAVYGASYGGYMTLMALTQAPHRWAAGCSLVGVVSLETMYRTTREDLREMLEAQMGSPDRDARLFRERSPLQYVDRIEAPLLVLQGKNDPRVPLSEARQLVEALREAGKAFSFYVYEGEGHGFRRAENRQDALVRALEFFDEHVKTPRSAPGAGAPVRGAQGLRAPR